MKKFAYIFLAVLLAVSGSVYVLERNGLTEFFQLKGENDRVSPEKNLAFKYELNNIFEALENGESETLNGAIENLIHTGPLIGRSQPEGSVLSREEIVFETNKNRTSRGIPSLSTNDVLDKVAEERMDDMFRQQYFDHLSPQGVEASQIAEAEGYQFIAIGENIALGNFPDSAALVEAWMDSPGHRENILSQNFTEVGVVVGKGMFEGDEVWISVQIFGRPLSDCPQPDRFLSRRIEENKQEIESLEIKIKNIQSEIEASQPGSQERAELIEEYNILVEQINPLILETKELIENFNLQVSAFNLCLSG